jgi:hypothetical protein
LKPNKDVIVDDDQEGPIATDGSTAERTAEKQTEKRRKSSLFKTSRPSVEKIVETKKGKRAVKKEEPV